MPAQIVKPRWKTLPLCLTLIFGASLTACSPRTLPPVVVTPPASLLEPCQEPQNSGDVLSLLQAGDVRGAALAHVRYALDVRDSIGLCNAQIGALRVYSESMSEAMSDE